MARRWLLNALALAVLWLFVRGVSVDPPITLVREGIIGVLVGLPTAYTTRRLYGGKVTNRSIRVVPYALLYLGAFIKELLVANLAVARVVLSPSLPMDPAVVAVPLRVRSDAAVTTIANSITLTPGTLTMDYDADSNTLFVHSLAVSDPDEIVEPIRVWEDYALAIFNEELKPGDPVPERDSPDLMADLDGTVADSNRAVADSNGAGVDSNGTVADSDSPRADSTGAVADSNGAVTDSDGTEPSSGVDSDTTAGPDDSDRQSGGETNG